MLCEKQLACGFGLEGRGRGHEGRILEGGKDKTIDFPLEPSQRSVALLTLILAQ